VAELIETVDLRKSFDDVEALRGLDLQVPAGSICGSSAATAPAKPRRSRSSSA